MSPLGINADLINVDLRPALEQSAQVDDAVMTMRRIDAITAARAQLEGNVPRPWCVSRCWCSCCTPWAESRDLRPRASLRLLRMTPIRALCRSSSRAAYRHREDFGPSADGGHRRSPGSVHEES